VWVRGSNGEWEKKYGRKERGRREKNAGGGEERR